MTPGRLVAALTVLPSQTDGFYAPDAGVGLFVEDHCWLTGADFVCFVDHAGSFDDDRVWTASVDLAAALATSLGVTSRQTGMLTVAAGRAGAEPARSVRDLLSGLDRAVTTTVVTGTVRHAERDAEALTVTVTGFADCRAVSRAAGRSEPDRRPAGPATYRSLGRARRSGAVNQRSWIDPARWVGGRQRPVASRDECGDWVGDGPGVACAGLGRVTDGVCGEPVCGGGWNDSGVGAA